MLYNRFLPKTLDAFSPILNNNLTMYRGIQDLDCHEMAALAYYRPVVIYSGPPWSGAGSAGFGRGPLAEQVEVPCILLRPVLGSPCIMQ